MTDRKNRPKLASIRTGAADAASVERFAQLAWALAHPARVQIIRLLLKRQACICGEIVDELPLAQSTVSQHLKILKEAGLVQGEIDGLVSGHRPALLPICVKRWLSYFRADLANQFE